MSMSVLRAIVCIGTAIFVMGCNQSEPASSPQASGEGSRESMEVSEFLLSEQPDGAKPVALARESVSDGDDVAILGRIGGGVNPWVDGRAAFTIVDPKLQPCQPDEGCPTPWDYCCSTDQLAENRALIKIIDDGGNTLEQDARTLLRLKELQTIVAKGRAKRDEAGNLTVLASGVYVVPESK
jgi:hypothetical protein